MIRFVPKIRVEGFTRALLASKSICLAVNTPRSLSVYLLIDEVLAANDPIFHWDQIMELTYKYHDLPDSLDSHRDTLLISSLLAKFENIFKKPDVRESALDAFFEAEYYCSLSNTAVSNGRLDSLLWLECSLTLDQIKQQVSKVLGRAPSWQSVIENGGWGPGASFALSREQASPELKSGNDRTITLPLARAIVSSNCDLSCVPWFNGPLVLVPGNLVVTVPKNTKTDRTIAIEPGLNSWCQKGIASFIRKRLRKVGIDLNDQSANALAALDADYYGLSTLDLRAASDGLPLLLLERIIPKDWWDLIEASRSERYTMQGRGKEYIARDYQKLSSMGNGFTFEIESLIFYCCAKVVGSAAPFVYGDDIIVERSVYKDLVSLLSVMGFRVNNEKSFHDVYFYESCGMFSYRGVDITPFRIKEGLYGPKDLIVFANKIRYYSHVRNHLNGCWRGFLPAWRMCVAWLPDIIRKNARAPLGAALALFVNLSEAQASYSQARGGFTFRALTIPTSVTEDNFEMLLWHRLRSLSDQAECSIYDQVLPNQGNIVKRSPKYTRILEKTSRGPRWVNTPACRVKLTGRLSIEQWYNFGPWR